MRAARHSISLAIVQAMVLAIASLLGEARPAAALTSDDRHRLSRAIQAAENSDWPWAERLVAQMGNPLAERYLHWLELTDNTKQLELAAYADFLRRQPAWPLASRIRARLEELAGQQAGNAERLQLLAEFPPFTGVGRVALAEALLAAGRDTEAHDLARLIWREEALDPATERQMLDRFGKSLKRADHEARLDRLLWEGRNGAAERMFRRVSTGQRALAEARLRLQEASPGVDGAIGRVPPSLRNDPGLLFDRLRWRRLKGRDADARQILLEAPDDLGHATLWWRERSYQIRELLDERRLKDAYRLARMHGQESGGTFAEAEWLAGWLALRGAGRAQEALKRFEHLFDNVSTPISRARAAYWAGRAATELGKDDAARRWYGEAAAHPTTFYGQEALAELGQALRLDAPAVAVVAAPLAPDLQELVDISRMLCEIDEGDRAMRFLRELQARLDDPHVAIAEAAACGRGDLVVQLGKSAVRAGRIDPVLTYPVPDLPGLLDPPGGGPEPALMLAVARQESHFDISARSGAGAVGLMQVMPATARAVARKLDIAFDETRLNSDAHLNLSIGAGYLRQLLAQFDDADYLAMAAYNAGPMRVRSWIDRYGDPRRMGRHERLDWLELIPYSETRNYVQRVLEGRSVYDWWLSSGGGWRISLRRPVGPMVPPPLPEAKPRTS